MCTFKFIETTFHLINLTTNHRLSPLGGQTRTTRYHLHEEAQPFQSHSHLASVLPA